MAKSTFEVKIGVADAVFVPGIGLIEYIAYDKPRMHSHYCVDAAKFEFIDETEAKSFLVELLEKVGTAYDAFRYEIPARSN